MNLEHIRKMPEPARYYASPRSMPAPLHIRPSKDKDAAAVLGRTAETRCVDAPPPAHARWLPVIEAFLQQFDRAVLSQLPDHQPPFRHPHPPLVPRRDRHDFYRSGLPTLTLAGSFRERNPKSCADAQDLLAPFGNPGDVPFRNPGITRTASFAHTTVGIEFSRFVNHFGLTCLLTPVFLRSGPTTHTDTIPKLIVLWCAFELDAVL